MKRNPGTLTKPTPVATPFDEPTLPCDHGHGKEWNNPARCSEPAKFALRGACCGGVVLLCQTHLDHITKPQPVSTSWLCVHCPKRWPHNAPLVDRFSLIERVA